MYILIPLGILYLQKSLYDLDRTYSEYHSNSGKTLSEWFAYLEQYHQRTLNVVHEKNDAAKIMMISSIPNFPAYTPKATLVLFINPDSLLHAIESMPFTEGTIMLILDEKNNVITSNIDVVITEDIRYENLLNQPEVFNCMIGGENTFVVQSTSPATNWKYVILVSAASISKDIRHIQSAAIIYLIVSLLIGGGLSLPFRTNAIPAHQPDSEANRNAKF